MKYKMLKRRDPLRADAPDKWYATPVHAGMVPQHQIAKDIVEASALSYGDLSSAIDNLMDTITKYLLMGHSVNLTRLGNFRLSFTSSGYTSPKGFKPKKRRNIKVVFRPSRELYKRINDLKVVKRK